MNILAYVIIGLFLGCVATAVTQKDRMGPLADIVTAIVGALIGGYGFSILSSTPNVIWDSLVASAVSGIILLVVVKSFMGVRHTKRPLSRR